jgi:hypothetical protein
MASPPALHGHTLAPDVAVLVAARPARLSPVNEDQNNYPLFPQTTPLEDIRPHPIGSKNRTVRLYYNAKKTIVHAWISNPPDRDS